MPNYDYECTSCGHTFEAFQSMSEDPLSTCPECGKTIRRLIGGGVGIIFKGSGFYVTDNKSGGGKSSGESESPSVEPKDDGAKKNETKSEKSETKEGKKSSKKSA